MTAAEPGAALPPPAGLTPWELVLLRGTAAVNELAATADDIANMSPASSAALLDIVSDLAGRLLHLVAEWST